MRTQTLILCLVVLIVAVAALFWLFPSDGVSPEQPSPHALDQSN
ncbi:MAG: hypothetical protein ACRECY_00955 [Phyllobacterium sp.]